MRRSRRRYIRAPCSITSKMPARRPRMGASPFWGERGRKAGAERGDRRKGLKAAGLLKSAEEAIAFYADRTPSFRAGDAQIVVVEDGSTDRTPEVLRDFAAGKAMYSLVHRQRASSPACARNIGVEASRGELLFFLDGDDLFLPAHIHHCLRALKSA